MKYKNIIAATAVLFLIIPTVSAYAQIQLPSQVTPPQLPPLPPLPPGAVLVPPSQQHGPPLAQIQSDLAKHLPQAEAQIQAITNEISHRLGNDNSTQHLAQVLKQMTAEGRINCPTPFTNPGHCFLTPKQIGIAPPIG